MAQAFGKGLAWALLWSLLCPQLHAASAGGFLMDKDLADKLFGRIEELETELAQLRARQEDVEMAQAKAALAPAQAVQDSPRQLQTMSDITGALDHMWLLICGAMVMLMQAGFALLEAGACREKNTQNLLLKNLSDICLGTLCWWSFGFMMAYGTDPDEPKASNNFAGNKRSFGHDFLKTVGRKGVHQGTDTMLSWFFQWAFCGAAATIVSGGVAERINFPGYVIYTTCMTTFIYPIVVYWTWSGSGWLYGGEDAVSDVGYYDFAGSGIVHMTGGIGALVGAIVLGPRKDRFTSSDDEFAPHNIPLVVLGTFILWFGWYGFNCGSTLGMSSRAQGQLAAQVAMNTTIAASTGGIVVLLLRLGMLKRYDVGGMCNGILAGLVSITAPCGNVESYSAFIIGILGALIYQGASSLLKLLKVDDPLDAFAVHGACGAWGALAALIFDWGKGLEYFNGWGGFDCTRSAKNGLCYKQGWSSALGAQVAGIICIALWVAGWSLIILVPMRIAGFLRAPDAVQDSGLDAAKHSPVKAYGHDTEALASSPKTVAVVPTS